MSLLCYLFGHKLHKANRPLVGFRCTRCTYWNIPKILIESPFAGDVATHIIYARRAMKDSFARGEAPWCSHLIYTQEGILDDTISGERAQGIEAGLLWGSYADITAVYTDYGISRGMKQGIARADKEKDKRAAAS